MSAKKVSIAVGLWTMLMLTACNNDKSNNKESSIEELRTTKILGTANSEEFLGLSCTVSDQPLVQKIMLELNLRQNMEYTYVEDTNKSIKLDLGQQDNLVVVTNNVLNQGEQLDVGESKDDSAYVVVTLEADGSNKYTITFMDETVLEILKNTDSEGKETYTKVGTTAIVDCDVFGTLEEIIAKINDNPAVDPGQSGPQ